MPDELTKALLLEEVASADAIAEALFASVTGGIPLVEALTGSGAVAADVLVRYLGRSQAPYLRQVAPVRELVERLPPGLCTRLLAVPVRRDAITGTVDVAVADATDPHPASEIAFHLGAPVRVVRSSRAAIQEGLRRLHSLSLPAPAHAPFPEVAPRDDERIYDSRPRATSSFDALSSEALRPSRAPVARYQAHVVPGPAAPSRRSSVTPPWGTPVHNARNSVRSEPPRSGLGSEIPIPLTRRTFSAVSGGTQRPPPLVDPAESMLGEGYPVDPGHFRQIVEVDERRRPSTDPGASSFDGRPAPVRSFIPGPPPVPRSTFSHGPAAAAAPHVPFADLGGILATLRAAGSRDEVLELVLSGARMVAFKVALFVVKRGGYLGWACTPEFGDRAALQALLVPGESASIFEQAARDGVYLGPLRNDGVHAALLHVMRGASRDVAAVPIRVSGKTAVIVLADELGDTMLATRRLEELAHAAGEAFTRIVRQRR